jgi:large subunit ribosomal protein L17
MRHKKSFNHLGRKSAHRKAMLSNMASSLIMHKRIETTTAKAKALKRYIEPLITRSKDDTTHSRRVVFSYLQDKEAVTELFREVGGRVADRPGGYTRIIRLGNRQGDNADMCLIELVDYNETLLAEKAAARKSAGRRRRGGKKKPQEAVDTAGTVATEEAAVEGAPAAEAPAEEEAEVAQAPAAEAPAEEVAEVAEVPAAEAPAEEEAPKADAVEEPGDEAGEDEQEEKNKDL